MTAQALPRNLAELRQRDAEIARRERRATVERIEAALQVRLDLIGGDPAYHLSELRLILKEAMK
jgi:hypothetical protein